MDSTVTSASATGRFVSASKTARGSHRPQDQRVCISHSEARKSLKTSASRFSISLIFSLINKHLSPTRLDSASYNRIGRHVFVHPTRCGPLRADIAGRKGACSQSTPPGTSGSTTKIRFEPKKSFIYSKIHLGSEPNEPKESKKPKPAQAPQPPCRGMQQRKLPNAPIFPPNPNQIQPLAPLETKPSPTRPIRTAEATVSQPEAPAYRRSSLRPCVLARSAFLLS